MAIAQPAPFSYPCNPWLDLPVSMAHPEV